MSLSAMNHTPSEALFRELQLVSDQASMDLTYLLSMILNPTKVSRCPAFNPEPTICDKGVEDMLDAEETSQAKMTRTLSKALSVNPHSSGATKPALQSKMVVEEVSEPSTEAPKDDTFNSEDTSMKADLYIGDKALEMELAETEGQTADLVKTLSSKISEHPASTLEMESHKVNEEILNASILTNEKTAASPSTNKKKPKHNSPQPSPYVPTVTRKGLVGTYLECTDCYYWHFYKHGIRRHQKKTGHAAGVTSPLKKCSYQLRVRASQKMGLAGTIWQCDHCPFWQYNKQGIRRHQKNGGCH